jgi:hypothetical protein
MALIIKTIASGTIATGGGTVDLYTVPTGKSVLVTSVRFANNGPSGASITLLVRPSGAGTSRRLSANLVPLGVGNAVVMEDAVTLGQGDKLQVFPSASSPGFDWMVNGLLRE